MTSERFRQVESIYHAILERQPDERASALAAACDGDAALQAEVQSLLERWESSGGFLDRPALDVAARLIPPARESLIGRRVGAFEVLALLGAGGMGEVYRARDTRLRRDVAIKILSGAFKDDPARVARFEREARVLAALNHPHIGAIYGLEDAGGRPSLVMELVDGEDLATRLARGALPVRDALEIAGQICDALEAAHGQGIVHRDLKPANIRRRPDGTVKVLDFGLARPMAFPGSGSASGADPTEVGTIVGTPAYMSPDQARGEAADSQSDIWSFGAVLYEMLTDISPFARNTTPDTLASVLEAQPDYSQLPSAVPEGIRRLIRRCLEKDRRRRLRHIGDARVEIEDSLAAMAGGAVEVRPDVPEVLRTDRWRWLAVALGLTTVVLLGLQAYQRYGATPPAVMRFAVHPPPGGVFQTPVIAGAAASVGGAISPDGRTLAFTATDASGKIVLWVRAIDALNARALPGTEGAALPFWSPDSRSLGFFASGKLKRIDVADGTLQDVCDVGRGVGGTWNRDGVILFARGLSSGLSRVDASGGAPQAVTTLGAGERSHRFPSFLPDGRRFLFYIDASPAQNAGVFVAELDGSDRRRIMTADSAAVYARSGHLLFVRQTTLYAQSFDAGSLRLAGEPVAMAERVPSDGASAAFSVSAGDVLTYRAGATDYEQQFAWFDRAGRLLDTVGPPGAYRGMDLSPDGTRIAVHRHDGAGGDVWVLEPGGATTRVTFNAAHDNSSPIWSPDGRRLAFASLREGRWGVYHKPADATDTEVLLVESEAAKSPASWSPDGTSIVYWLVRNSSPDQWLIPADRDVTGYSTRDSQPAPLMQSRFAETHSQISPDGRWVAYSASTTGRLEVYVRPFPSGDAVFPVSTAGGVTPRWRPDGKELFYATGYDGGALMTVAARGESSAFVSGAPRKLFDTGIRTPPHSPTIPFYHTYGVSPDGQRFLIPRPISRLDGNAEETPITVVLHWSAERK